MNYAGIPDATTESRGLMSGEDKAKVETIPEGGSPVVSVTDGNGLALTGGVLAMGAASGAAPGAMSAAHFTKLSALMTEAELEAALAAIIASIPTTTAALPDSTNRRYVTDVQSTVLGNTSGTNTGDVTVSSVTGWLSQVGQALTFALVAASDVVDGVVNRSAQTIAGVKTFTSAIVASAGIQLASIWNTNGSGSSDVCVKGGTTVSDGAFNANAHLFELVTGLGGTESKKFWVNKLGPAMSANGQFTINGDAGGVFITYRTADGMAGITNGAAAYLGMFPGSGSSGCSGNFTAGGSLLSSNAITLQATAKPVFIYAAGSSGLYDSVRLVSTRGDSTLTCVAVGTEHAAPNAACVLFQVAKSIGTASTAAANGTPVGLQVLGDGTTKARGPLQLNEDSVARPAATAANRGTIWYSRSANGAADTVQACLKSVGDTYSWVTIATG